MSAHEVVVPLVAAQAESESRVGSKGRALGVLLGSGMPVEHGFVVTTEAYRRFVSGCDALEVAAAEIARRARVAARAEEYWDSSQRIRSAFMRAAMSAELSEELLDGLKPLLATPVAVRSSAAHLSRTGRALVRMHDSTCDVRGERELLRAIRAAWASLFSDRALLYREENGLDPEHSAMAVVVQPMVVAEGSAVVFTRHTYDEMHAVIEAVRGSGERLSSGAVEPHRWVVDRVSGVALEYLAPTRADSMADRVPVLDDAQVLEAWALAAKAEALLGEAQACELALTADARLVVIESRPSTEIPEDDRRVYLDARLPLSRLDRRRERIESEFLPSMWSEANALSVVDVAALPDGDLVAEASRRAEAVAHWRHLYRTVLAPFAHGQRLFGEYHVRMVPSAGPFDFIGLLVRTPEEYEQRRQILAELGIEPPGPPAATGDRDAAEETFLASLLESEREHALWLLGLARASWRMRDDDNLYLDRIEAEARRALDEIERRLRAEPGDSASLLGPASRAELARAAEDLRVLLPGGGTVREAASPLEKAGRPRVLVGDPASSGVGSGPARVVRDIADATALREDEVLVVDELHPELTAVAARARAIVERRGGMFAHGAVLGREHGVPCVTGILDATSVIGNGEYLTVDGDGGTVSFG